MQNKKSNEATAQHSFTQESYQVQKALKTKTGYIWNDENGGWRCYAKVGDEITSYSKRYASEANAMSDFINWAKDVYGPNVKLNWQKGNYEELKRCLIANGDLKPEVKVQESSQVQKAPKHLDEKFECELERGYIMQKIAIERMEIAWMKVMTMGCDVDRLRPENEVDQRRKEKAKELLLTAQKAISDAKGEIMFMSGITCADFINALGSHKTLDEHIAEFRRPHKRVSRS